MPLLSYTRRNLALAGRVEKYTPVGYLLQLAQQITWHTYTVACNGNFINPELQDQSQKILLEALFPCQRQLGKGEGRGDLAFAVAAASGDDRVYISTHSNTGLRSILLQH